jgi:ParB family chromosome partitioning protein
MTINIPIEKLHPHPKNPRMDEGDVTELAASIKSLGLHHNLVVVETEPGEAYTIVAGHRRLKAAKLLNLAYLPCLVSDMGEREQMASMMSENVHRSALSPYEEGRGFQMMLDLGDTQKSISELTGLSATTVRSRVKLLELDADKFKASSERGATLSDYAALNDIEDVAERNKLLDVIGTENFKYRMIQAVNDQKRKKIIAGIKAVLDAFAEERADEPEGTVFIRQYNETHKAVDVPGDAGTRKYYYHRDKYGYALYLYADKTEAEQLESDEEDAAQAESEAKNAERWAAEQAAFDTRAAFIKDISPAQCRKLAPQIAAFAARAMIGKYSNSTYMSTSVGNLCGVLGLHGTLDVRAAVDSALQDTDPQKVLLAEIWAVADNKYCQHYGNMMVALYAELEALGYETSDDERALYGGAE